MFRRHFSFMSLHLHGFEFVIELISTPYGERLFPASRVRVKRICEMMMTPVRIGIRRGGRTQQREPQNIALCVVSVLRFIDQAKPMLAVAEVSPAHGRNLELSRFPAIIPRGRPFDC